MSDKADIFFSIFPDLLGDKCNFVLLATITKTSLWIRAFGPPIFLNGGDLSVGLQFGSIPTIFVSQPSAKWTIYQASYMRFLILTVTKSVMTRGLQLLWDTQTDILQIYAQNVLCVNWLGCYRLWFIVTGTAAADWGQVESEYLDGARWNYGCRCLSRIWKVTASRSSCDAYVILILD